MIQGSWYVLEAVAPRAARSIARVGRRWQFGPAAVDDPGGHALIARRRVRLGTSPSPRRLVPEVVQALTIRASWDHRCSCPDRRQDALGSAGVEEIGDDLVAAAVSDAARVARALGVTN